MKALTFLSSIILLFLSNFAAADSPTAGQWDIERLQDTVPPSTVLNDEAAIISLTYEGEPIKGKKTEVFALYASPKTLGEDTASRSAPGIVLIHGGGGTAFADWVWLWAERGYAAIAMDLAGCRPPDPEFDEEGQLLARSGFQRESRTRLERGGLGHGPAEKFESIGGSAEDDWPYHAVANVMRANSLLRSFDEVDPERIAVTGISWGGYTTCLVASLDDRFAAAVPVYGCGFLADGDSVQRPAIDKLGSRRQQWISAYDPASHLPKCQIPMLWVNGTHDVHYPLDSWARSYQLVSAPRQIRVEHRMGHSHQAGWAPIEIGIFVDSLLKGGDPLPEFDLPSIGLDGLFSVVFYNAVPLREAVLYYTSDEGLRAKRTWQAVEATIDEEAGVISAAFPHEANTWVLCVTDERGAMVSTDVGFRAEAP
ncbi:MAG: prolyl oligopeptidase family serine peptidase [Verrucomicrobiota bacterium]